MESLLGFDTLGDQGLRERFDLSLNRVLANLADPNTDPKVTRSLGLKPTWPLTFRPKSRFWLKQQKAS